jgi:hypothetical protein
MSSPVDDLKAYLDRLPLDAAEVTNILELAAKIGQGAPMRAEGSNYGALEDELAGPRGTYPPPRPPVGSAG